jgi:hypothetical protein
LDASFALLTSSKAVRLFGPAPGEYRPLAFSEKTIKVRSSTKREGLEMQLTPPTTVVFIISVILAALAIIGKFAAIPFFTEHGFWVAIIAYVILAIGNLFRGV